MGWLGFGSGFALAFCRASPFARSCWLLGDCGLNDLLSKQRRGLLESTTLQGMEQLSFTENPPPAASLRSALIIVSTLPVLFIYPFVQRYFVKGILIGGVKG